MNSYRYILIIFFINLIVISGSGVYNTITYNNQDWAIESAILDDHALYMTGQWAEESTDADNFDAADDFGDQKGGASIIWQLARNGLAPIPERQDSTTLDHYLIRGVNYFRYGIMIMSVMWLFFVLYNKKYD